MAESIVTYYLQLEREMFYSGFFLNTSQVLHVSSSVTRQMPSQ